MTEGQEEKDWIYFITLHMLKQILRSLKNPNSIVVAFFEAPAGFTNMPGNSLDVHCILNNQAPFLPLLRPFDHILSHFILLLRASFFNRLRIDYCSLLLLLKAETKWYVSCPQYSRSSRSSTSKLDICFLVIRALCFLFPLWIQLFFGYHTVFVAWLFQGTPASPCTKELWYLAILRTKKEFLRGSLM